MASRKRFRSIESPIFNNNILVIAESKKSIVMEYEKLHSGSRESKNNSEYSLPKTKILKKRNKHQNSMQLFPYQDK